MTSSDDPPFLNVGTEVSAKYRGAFCEATIKIAKKLVKCKVSYTKGGTEVVSNDVIKGPLKVNATVEVRGSDGVYVSGVITRLTDASTYTVVFDDNDERTLKRSSLCLKGARHYSASESLDQMPLTDPENFGTPVHYQSKRGQRKRQPQSSSASPESGNDTTVLSPPKKQATPQATPTNKKQPEEFPVGRCVFLENDRRRSCWLPAVVVPSHYVMDVSEVSEDTVCIRSFKDGRFYAAKVEELHSFAPGKEPLSSMLEGEIQAMFMCKPAIERAMAYLDTGELPWDMQLLDTKESLNSKDEAEPTENQTAEKENFYKRLRQFQEERNITVPQKPLLCHKELDLFKLHCLVKENGGMERVTQELKWRSLYLQLGLPPATNSSHIIKQAYKKHLNAFDIYERTRLETKSPRGPRKRPAVMSSDNEDESSKVMKLETTDPVTPIVLPPPNSSPSPLPLSSSTESMGESSTADRLVEGGGARGGAQVDEIKVNDRIKVMYGKGRTLQNYEAKVLEVDGLSYYVHYNGWNTRYDEWIDNSRVVEKVTTPSKGVSRPPYARKKQTKFRPKPSKDSTVHSSADSKPQETPPTVTMPTVTTPTNTCERLPKGKRRRVSSNTDHSSSDTPSPGESTPLPADKHTPTAGSTLPPPDSAHSHQIDSSPDTVKSEDIPIKAHANDSLAVEPSPKEEETDPPLEEEREGEVGGDTDSSSDDESVPVPSPPAPPTSAPPTGRQAPSPPPPPTLVPSDHQLPSPIDPVDPGLTLHTPTEDQLYNNNNSLMEAESEVMDTPPSPVGPQLLDTLVEGQEVSVGGGGASSDEKMIQREDLDFSIDMSIYNGLNSSERISLIQDRMKAIQNKYMELKSEVTYLDRKRRRARKREREVARLMASRGSGLSAEESINNLITASSMQQGMDIEASS